MVRREEYVAPGREGGREGGRKEGRRVYKSNYSQCYYHARINLRDEEKTHVKHRLTPCQAETYRFDN
jgi:hypothetical protein